MLDEGPLVVGAGYLLVLVIDLSDSRRTVSSATARLIAVEVLKILMIVDKGGHPLSGTGSPSVSATEELLGRFVVDTVEVDDAERLVAPGREL